MKRSAIHWLPAEAYDALRALVTQFDGVGAGRNAEHGESIHVLAKLEADPWSLQGFGVYLDASASRGPIGDALFAAGLSDGLCNSAVRGINQRGGQIDADADARVSWIDFAERLRIKRKPSIRETAPARICEVEARSLLSIDHHTPAITCQADLLEFIRANEVRARENHEQLSERDDAICQAAALGIWAQVARAYGLDTPPLALTPLEKLRARALAEVSAVPAIRIVEGPMARGTVPSGYMRSIGPRGRIWGNG